MSYWDTLDEPLNMASYVRVEAGELSRFLDTLMVGPIGLSVGIQHSRMLSFAPLYERRDYGPYDTSHHTAAVIGVLMQRGEHGSVQELSFDVSDLPPCFDKECVSTSPQQEFFLLGLTVILERWWLCQCGFWSTIFSKLIV